MRKQAASEARLQGLRRGRPVTPSSLLEQNATDAAPWQVKRAEEYIAENAHRAISLEELADVTGVSAFSLFAAFRKHRGYSPREFVTRVRAKHGATR